MNGYRQLLTARKVNQFSPRDKPPHPHRSSSLKQAAGVRGRGWRGEKVSGSDVNTVLSYKILKQKKQCKKKKEMMKGEKKQKRKLNSFLNQFSIIQFSDLDF